MERKLQGP